MIVLVNIGANYTWDIPLNNYDGLSEWEAFNDTSVQTSNLFWRPFGSLLQEDTFTPLIQRLYSTKITLTNGRNNRQTHKTMWLQPTIMMQYLKNFSIYILLHVSLISQNPIYYSNRYVNIH